MKKILLRFLGLVALGILTGCAGMGAVMSTSDDPATRALGTLMYVEGSHEQRMREAEAGRSQVNVNTQGQSPQQGRTGLPENVVYSDGKYSPASGYTWINPNDQNDLRVIPKNVIVNADGSFKPAPGYTWINPNDQKDLRVKKKNHEGYFTVDTSGKWYIDKNIILGNTISDETKSIYSAIIQDSSLSIKSGDNARAHYIEALKKIDFQQSPDEFKEAYMRHIDAWERNSKDEIGSTWNEVERIALKYGVRKK
jgi:hypothetical protein